MQAHTLASSLRQGMILPSRSVTPIFASPRHFPPRRHERPCAMPTGRRYAPESRASLRIYGRILPAATLIKTLRLMMSEAERCSATTPPLFSDELLIYLATPTSLPLQSLPITRSARLSAKMIDNFDTPRHL